MFVITLADEAIRPDARLTIRTSRDDEWQREVVCHQDPQTGEWGSPPLPDSSLPLRFKFLRDNAWELGAEHVVTQADIVAGRYSAHLNAEGFSAESGLIVSNPVVAQRFFPPELDGDRPFDVYVIGSGAGGGCLAHSLVAREKNRADVLVLEAGSYLFPTHVGNLPRRRTPEDNEATLLWSLWREFRAKRDGSLTAHGVDLAEGLCLGGKSLFWGALVPEMSEAEFAAWPARVRQELLDRWYGHAKDLLNAQRPPLLEYQKLVKDRLRAVLPGLSHEDAQMAVQRLPARSWGVPAGVFSTADLLMEDRLLNTTADHLTVNLNHQVTRLVLEDVGAEKRVTSIVCRDHVAHRERVFTVPDGSDVVLAAGTLSSPVIALNSGLDNGLIGAGLTDHTTYYRKFTIPKTSPLYHPLGVCKVVSQRPPTGPGEPALNVIVSLGTDLCQFRAVDEDRAPAVAADTMSCEVVFFYEGKLVDSNEVGVSAPDVYGRPLVKVSPEADDGLIDEVRSISDKVIDEVCQGKALSGVQRAQIGAVGHEAGTMRMGADASTAVVDKNLRVFGTENLFVCDLSVFPTSPAANPTLTLAALAIRLGEFLANRP